MTEKTCEYCKAGIPLERYVVPQNAPRVENRGMVVWRHPLYAYVYGPCADKDQTTTPNASSSIASCADKD